MTNEEAIVTLKANYPDACYEQLREAVDTAIAALEAYVPEMNVGDMISRRAAIDALDCINGVEEVLRSLPAVQPAIIHCKNCEHWDTSWETAYGLHYCPMIDMATKKNFFCKYGAEKRGDTE